MPIPSLPLPLARGVHIDRPHARRSHLATGFLIHAVLLACVVGDVAGAEAANPFDVLDKERQTQLYYEVEELPQAVKALIEAKLSVAQIATAYAKTDDQIKKFNLVLILDKKAVSGQLNQAEMAAANAFFRDCLGHANPWIKTEAVFALGNADGAVALPAIERCLKDRSLTVVYHAAIAIQMISGRDPKLTDEQADKVRKVAALPGIAEKNALAELELKEYIKTEIL